MSESCKHGADFDCDLCAEEDAEHDAFMARHADLEAELATLQGMREEVLHYQREFHRLRDELAEQYRLNGMGSEREARLMAKVAELEHKWLSPEAYAELMRERGETLLELAESQEREAAMRELVELIFASTLPYNNGEPTFSDKVTNMWREIGCGSERAAAFETELVACEATIAKLWECINYYHAFIDMLNDGPDESDVDLATFWLHQGKALRKELLGLPQDRSALDAALAKAKREGMLEAAAIADEIRQAAEKIEK